MIAQVCDLGVGELVISTGDTHIYLNHIDQVREQLSREPITTQVELRMNPTIKDINQFKMTDIELVNYLHHGPIKAPMAV
jgi:thymidylate synthase